LRKVQEEIKWQADRGRKKAEEWKKGDKVMLSTKDFFFKSTIYYTGCNSSSCLQEELCIEYQYPNLFMQLPNTKDY